jgi:hypothetical protein
VGLGARRAGVAATVGLGQPERAEPPAGHEVGEPAQLLLLRAEGVDRVGAEANRGRERDAERLADDAELFDRDAQGGEVAAATAPLLTEHDAEQAKVGHRRDRIQRQLAGRFPTVDVRREVTAGEVADHCPERLVLVGELDHAPTPPERSLG